MANQKGSLASMINWGGQNKQVETEEERKKRLELEKAKKMLEKRQAKK